MSNCDAVQAQAVSGGEPAIVQTDTGYSGGAFGAIRPAQPWKYQQPTAPPIVSADKTAPQVQTNLPPIVTAESLQLQSPMAKSQSLPPIVSAEQASQEQAKPRNFGNMLSPIKPAASATASAPAPAMTTPAARTPVEMSNASVANISSPAPSITQASLAGPAPAIIQATAAPTDSQVDPNVQQAAQWSSQNGYHNAGYSSAGIPLYSQDAPGQLPGAIAGTPTAPMATTIPPIVSTESPMISPSDTMITQAPITVAPAPAMTGQTYFAPTVMDAPAIVDSGCASCSSCGGGGCNSCSSPVSSCQSCGSGGCYNEGAVANQFGCCGSVYSARRYMVADALYFDRDDGIITNSNFGSLSNFDWDWGWRVTLGTRADATSGNEMTYMGTMPLEQVKNITDAAGRIDASFITGGGFTGVETTAFNDVVQLNESKETELHTLEFNRVKWGWDVIKTFVGMRYIYVDDQYQMFTENLGGETGSFQMGAMNHMIGPHIGGELFYDIGYRFSYSFFGKAGGYVNFNEVDTVLINNGARHIDAEDTNVTISGSLEFGLIGHYQLSRQARFRVGYNVLWLGEVASVSDNFSPVVSPFTGTDTSDSDDMFFHGVSFGLEVYR